MSYEDEVSFSELVGKTILSIRGAEGGSDRVDIETNDGKFAMFHEQDCCEGVGLEEVLGSDPNDLVGAVVLAAEESSNSEDPHEQEYAPESYTWTYYTIQTEKGFLKLRWFGSSNGYYSESVSFQRVPE